MTPHRLDALLVITTTLLVTMVPLLPPNAGTVAAGAIALLAVVAWLNRCRAAAPLSAVYVVCLAVALFGVPYSQLVLGLGLVSYAAVVRMVPWLRGTATWARWGSFASDVRLLCAAAVLIAGAALLTWYFLLHPNLDDIVNSFVPDLPLGLLIAGGLIFSMINAAVEEGAYRGVVLHALDTSLGPGLVALVLQAVAFGTLHIQGGFPRGWLGAGLACIFGIFMGVVRRRAGGMFAPWIAHVVTDVVIAGIVLTIARPHLLLYPINAALSITGPG